MGFKYQLATPDGDVFGEAEYSYEPSAGDEVYVSGAEQMRVTAVIPVELAAEHVNGAIYGLLEVEPV